MAEPGGGQRGWWVVFGLAVIAGLFALLTAVIALAETSTSEQAVPPGVAAIIVFGIATGLLAWLAWAAEHRARGRVRHHEADVASDPVPRRRSTGPVQGRRNTPTALLVDTGVFSVAAVGCLLGAVALGHGWRQSVATQDHGLAFPAKVTKVVRVTHSTRSGTYHTSHLTVLFPHPVGATMTAVIHAPHDEDPELVGSLVNVRVERSDPHHVELAGVPGENAAGFVMLLIGGVICLAIALAFARASVHLRRLRRAGDRGSGS